MATAYPARAPATHPIHAILSAYPLAFFTGALATDIIYARTAEMQWANFSIWLITGGLLMAAFAVVAGIVDALAHRGRVRRARPWWHGVLTVVMLVFALVNAFLHSRDAWTSVVPAGLVLSAIVTVLALVTSWTGYTLQARGEVR